MHEVVEIDEAIAVDVNLPKEPLEAFLLRQR